MAKCSICGKEINDDDRAIYGIIEKYHYDTRITTLDNDNGPTTYKAIAIVRGDMCQECGKKATVGLLKDALKSLGGSLLAILIGLITSPLSKDFGGLLAFAGLLGIIVSIGMLVKSFLPNNKTKKIFNGKVNKENVLYPISDEDLNVEDIPGDYYNRHDYKFLFIDEEKLNKPEKATKHETSYDAALNTLKQWYKSSFKATNEYDNNKYSKEDTIQKNQEEVVLKNKKENTSNSNDILNKEDVKTKTNVLNLIVDKIKTIPKIAYYILGGLIAITLVVVILVAVLSKNQVNINDYLVFDTFGSEGDAITEIYVDYDKLLDDAKDSIKLKKDYQSIEATDENQETLNIIIDLLDKCILEPKDLVLFFYLDNGDMSECEYYIDNVLTGFATDDDVRNLREASFNNKLVYAYTNKGDEIDYIFSHDFDFINAILETPIINTDGTHTISEIRQPVEIDFESFIKAPYVTFEGADGFATAKITISAELGEEVYYDGRTWIYVESNNENDIEFALGQKGEQIISLKYEIENPDYLSNGDIVTLRLSNASQLKQYGLYAKSDTIEVQVSGLPEISMDREISGDSFTLEMIEDYIKQQVENDENSINDLKINSAIYFKTPDEIENDEPITIVIDYTYYSDYFEKDRCCLGTIYNPTIVNGKIYATRYEASDAQDFYKPLQEEFAQVGINKEIDDYGDFLEILESSDMDKLISAGLEEKNTIEAIRYLLLNDSLYIIVRK